MRPKYEIVLRAMQREVEVEFPDGFTRTMIEGEVCERVQVWLGTTPITDPPDEERWLVSEMPLNWFLKECEKMADEDVTILAANLALNSLKR